MEKMHAAVARSAFASQHAQNTTAQDHFLKWHGAVARSTFASQHVQDTTASDHFLKFRCRKNARRCSEKYIFKSRCTQHSRFGPLFEVQMSTNCTLLEVPMLKSCPTEEIDRLILSESVIQLVSLSVKH